MNIRHRHTKRNSSIKGIIITNIKNNIKEYIIISTIFIIGIILGVMFINKISEYQHIEITNYINTFINSLKDNATINDFELLKNSIKNNFLLTFFLWFMGSTIIGISVVYLTICFRGFCLGYTISSIILTCGLGKGLLFLLSAIFLQNIIFIPIIIALAVSGMKLHKSILKDRGRENIKLEILRHTLFSLVMLIILIISSFIEVYLSKNILLLLIKYI